MGDRGDADVVVIDRERPRSGSGWLWHHAPLTVLMATGHTGVITVRTNAS
jgi:hypothetical protein